MSSIYKQEDFRTKVNLVLIFVIILVLGIGCTSPTQVAESPSPISLETSVTPTAFQPLMHTLFISSGTPQSWRFILQDQSGLEILDSSNRDGLTLTQKSPSSDEKVFGDFKLIYAAVVQFPTVEDDITMEELKGLWQGGKSDLYDQLLIDEETRLVFKELWGNDPSGNVKIIKANEILAAAWKDPKSVALIPFEEISPRWKVLKINGISPLDKPMKVSEYPLTISYYLVGAKANEEFLSSQAAKIIELLPATNRDESKMTVVVMSGTTALVRTTAYKIEFHGVDYPISEVKDWFLSADIRHVSNEISFNKDCPDPDPWTTSLRFCSNIKYLPVLQGLGINVVELTGNHLNDYDPEKLAETTAIYKENGMDYYGGGNNLADAQKPLEITSNGNKIAFIGCNFVGPKSDFATADKAGSAPCDQETFYAQISRLKNEGYVVIATYQHNEVYVYMFDEAYQTEFLEAANAGADIIQGSQAHFPMGFEFSGESLIHYGLGNFLFDQMDYPVIGTRREFVDRHIIYDNRYVNTELLTAYLTDWSKPVPMTADERSQFLTDIFNASKMR
jgi:hypothetical protein